MSLRVEEITAAALALSDDERAALADQLVESLDPLEDEAILGLWVEEAKHRLAELDSGRVEPIDGEQVLKEVRESLRK